MAQETLTFPHLWDVLDEYGNRVRNVYQDNLIRADKIATGGLLNSVEFSVVQYGRRFDVVLTLADYWKWVEEGRKPGKMPPPSAILAWVLAKPVIPKPNANGRIPTPQSLAWAIAKSIGKNGIAPTPALKQASDATFAEMERDIAAAFAEDVGENALLAFQVFGRP